MLSTFFTRSSRSGVTTGAGTSGYMTHSKDTLSLDVWGATSVVGEGGGGTKCKSYMSGKRVETHTDKRLDNSMWSSASSFLRNSTCSGDGSGM